MTKREGKRKKDTETGRENEQHRLRALLKDDSKQGTKSETENEVGREEERRESGKETMRQAK